MKRSRLKRQEPAQPENRIAMAVMLPTIYFFAVFGLLMTSSKRSYIAGHHTLSRVIENLPLLIVIGIGLSLTGYVVGETKLKAFVAHLLYKNDLNKGNILITAICWMIVAVFIFIMFKLL